MLAETHVSQQVDIYYNFSAEYVFGGFVCICVQTTATAKGPKSSHQVSSVGHFDLQLSETLASFRQQKLQPTEGPAFSFDSVSFRYMIYQYAYYLY